MIDCDCVPGHRCDCWDYRNAPDAGLRADPNDLLALCDAADKDGRHTVQTSTIRAWVRAALASSPAPAGLDGPYGGHPEFGPRVVANTASPSIAGWEALAKDALLAFDECRAAPAGLDALERHVLFVSTGDGRLDCRCGDWRNTETFAQHVRRAATRPAEKEKK